MAQQWTPSMSSNWPTRRHRPFSVGVSRAHPAEPMSWSWFFFMMWLFNNRSNFGEYVNLTLLERMEEVDATDKARRTLVEKPSKMHLSLRKLICTTLLWIQAVIPVSHPLTLTSLPFNVFAWHLATFKKSVTHRNCKKQSITISNKVVTVLFSVLSFDGASSLVAHLHHKCGLDRDIVSKDLWSKIGKYKKWEWSVPCCKVYCYNLSRILLHFNNCVVNYL